VACETLGRTGGGGGGGDGALSILTICFEFLILLLGNEKRTQETSHTEKLCSLQSKFPRSEEVSNK
jgi:hypothetical protein